MISYKLNRIENGIFTTYTHYYIDCPSCQNVFKVDEKEINSIKKDFGYYTDSITCDCGYTADFIVSEEKHFNSKAEFTKTCKKCEDRWSFTLDDVSPEEQDYYFIRCDKCGSRKISLHLD